MAVRPIYKVSLLLELFLEDASDRANKVVAGFFAVEGDVLWLVGGDGAGSECEDLAFHELLEADGFFAAQ